MGTRDRKELVMRVSVMKSTAWALGHDAVLVEEEQQLSTQLSTHNVLSKSSGERPGEFPVMNKVRVTCHPGQSRRLWWWAAEEREGPPGGFPCSDGLR